ncbi:MAG: response regulator [bacterium]|jgi:CheY-like chemotaxis protein|nr:response regulator [candidate division KSB1 bacterium]MDH7561102.1 response regulator [bacterium]
MTKVLYAEDVEFLRQGICADLREAGFEVASCPLDRQEALRNVEAQQPDVLLLDVMSEMNIHEGLSIAAHLREHPLRKQGRMKVLLLTIFRQDDEAIRAALAQGLADGIVTKPTTSERIVREITRVMRN